MNKEEKIIELKKMKYSIEENILFEERIINMYKERIKQIQEAIPKETKMLESLKGKLNSAKEAIPDFDIETYNLYKEYAVLEDKVQQEKVFIDKLNAENIEKKDEVAKAEQILTEKKAELQMIEAELEVEIKNLIQN